jgi:hypothetical protein
MRDIAHGNNDPRVIGLRHDVDDNRMSLHTALQMAEWEKERGYRSTYFLLHDSSYWPEAPAAALELVDMGHEVGLHNNALAQGIRQKRAPFTVLRESLDHLRESVNVTGTSGHGDEMCYGPGRVLRFCNDELWTECDRGMYRGEKRSMADFGLQYDSAWLKRGDYVSDSGHVWNPTPTSLSEATLAWPSRGQLHMLVHPDWWVGVFDRPLVAA